MKTATIRELRYNFSRLFKWLENGETVQIVKHGKPFARVIPELKKGEGLLGACPGTVPLPSDIDDPVDVEWDAMK